jgi:hypothetical protein
MTKLRFPIAAVLELAHHAKAATNHSSGYGEDPVGPALILVGDNGVYFMSNGLPGIPKRDGGEGSHVVYADRCDPSKDLGWYDLKRATFGGDDGAEMLTIVDSVIEEEGRGYTHVEVALTQDQIKIGFVTERAKAA